MVIVDTSVWVDYLNAVPNPETSWLRIEINRQVIGLTDLVLCEVLQGLRDDAAVAPTRSALAGCVVHSSGGEDLAVASALNYRRLRAAGITIRKTIDCLIATFCIENDHIFLHRDRDFDAFETRLGLKVVHVAENPYV